MKRLLVFCAVAATIFACSKDKFKTTPTVEIKSFGPGEVFAGTTFSLDAVVTDKEGDLQDTLILYKKRFDSTGRLLSTDSLQKYKLGNLGVPTHDRLEINMQYSYGPPQRDGFLLYNTEVKNTFLSIGIVVRDNAGNRSTYVESDKILLHKP